jgi:hypothetical protein
MYAKKLKRKCMVRGCRNLDTYAISRTREHGNSVIICLDCLNEAIKAAKEADKNPKPKYVPKPPPKLFYLGKVKKKPDEAETVNDPDVKETAGIDTDEKADVQVVEAAVNTTESANETGAENKAGTTAEQFICQYCGRECNGKMGLLRHESSCAKKAGEINEA